MGVSQVSPAIAWWLLSVMGAAAGLFFGYLITVLAHEILPGYLSSRRERLRLSGATFPELTHHVTEIPREVEPAPYPPRNPND